MATAKEDDVLCAICLDVAVEAVETTCCHHLYCALCISGVQPCPTCRRADFETTPSPVVRRIVHNLPAKCPYCETTTLTRGALDAHTSRCPERVWKCPMKACAYGGTSEKFLEHLVRVHGETVLQNAHILTRDSVGRGNAVSEQDPIAITTNSRGRTARLGETGKFYCGGQLAAPHCTCCNGVCGPTNGCNCLQCMQLDVRMRQLPLGYLVNRDGATARRGEGGDFAGSVFEVAAFYCGRRVLVYDRFTDGYCGPTAGNNCPACKKLDEQARTRYTSLL